MSSQPLSALDDDKTALALAKKCGPVVGWIAEAIGETRGSHGTRA